MRSIRVMVLTILILTAASACSKPEKPVNDNSLFVTKSAESDELPSYGCVRLRRGDTIELTGVVSAEKTNTLVKKRLTTSTGRVFILTDGTSLLKAGRTYRIQSMITFEGNDERFPELSVLSYKPIKRP